MPYSHMAEHVRSKGRGADTMLIHMTPHEVGGLQALAMAHGGSLTINPDTGLPEAGWLGKLLPTILGGIGMAFGIPPIWMGALGAVGGTAITGNLKEGLMAGLGAFGGASMAGAAGLGGAAGHLGSSIGLSGSQAAVMHPVASVASNAARSALPSAIANTGSLVAAPTAAQVGSALLPAGTAGIGGAAGTAGLNAAGQAIANTGSLVPSFTPAQIGANLLSQGAPTAVKTSIPGFFQGFGESAQAGLGHGLAAKLATPLATMGALGGISNALTPSYKAPKDKKEVDEYGYTGPYQAHREVLNPYDAANTPFNPASFDSSERMYFGPTSYTDASGKEWTPGQKTTPTAANASSFMANPVTITPEERMRLFGYAEGGPVRGQYMFGGPSDFATSYPSQTSAQQPQHAGQHRHGLRAQPSRSMVSTCCAL